MRKALDDGQIVIVAGFQGIDEDYNITTLGRGRLGHHRRRPGRRHEARPRARRAPPARVGCEIYTDVDGVYTTEPACRARGRGKMDAISYDEMLEPGQRRRRRHALAQHREFAKKFERARAGAQLVQ